MSQGVLAITEQIDGVFRKVTFEALSEGKRIADSFGCDLTAVVLGSGVENISNELGKYGAGRILVADNPALKEYLTDAYTNVIADIIEKEDPKDGVYSLRGISAVTCVVCPPLPQINIEMNIHVEVFISLYTNYICSSNSF